MGAEGDEVRPSSRVVMTFEANGTTFMFVRVVFHGIKKTTRSIYEDSQFFGVKRSLLNPSSPALAAAIQAAL
jgi:hypothetical protein